MGAMKNAQVLRKVNVLVELLRDGKESTAFAGMRSFAIGFETARVVCK